MGYDILDIVPVGMIGYDILDIVQARWAMIFYILYSHDGLWYFTYCTATMGYDILDIIQARWAMIF